MAMRVSADSLEKLSRANRIASNVWSVDAILRVLSYSGLLGAEMLAETNGGKRTALAQFLAGFFLKLHETRFINRIGSFPATVESALRFARESGKPDLVGKLGRAMTWSMLLHAPIEYLWLLSTFKPNVIKIDSPWWSRWSCRTWAMFIVADLLRTQVLAQRAMRAQAETKDAQHRDALTLEVKYQVLYTTVVLTDLVTALNFSVTKPPVSSKTMCGVGIYGGFASLWLKWLRSRPQPC